MIQIKSEKEIEKMRTAGRITAMILDEMGKMVAPGVSTLDLDEYALKRCKDLDVIPAFKGYHDFPGCVCASVNDEIVHGIPSAKTVLKEGDIIGLDFGTIVEGWYGDTARTFAVGNIAEEAKKLMDVTRESLMRGISSCRVGNRLFDIGNSVQSYVETNGFSVVREFVGHGIGRALHEDPQVPNCGPKGKGAPLKVGMVLAIEPMVNVGTQHVEVLKDGWTAVTADGKLSAHFEHTIAITSEGPEILTLPPQ